MFRHIPLNWAVTMRRVVSPSEVDLHDRGKIGGGKVPRRRHGKVSRRRQGGAYLLTSTRLQEIHVISPAQREPGECKALSVTCLSPLMNDDCDCITVRQIQCAASVPPPFDQSVHTLQT